VIAKLVLQHVERSCSLKLEDIPKRVEVFTNVLREILGSSSVIIENIIVRSLYSQLGLEFEYKEDYSFLDHLKELRRRCAR